jgi:hypothetical protein
MRALGFSLRLPSPMLVIGFLVVLAGIAHAAAPAVTAFSPASGTIGTNLTITGTGFAGAKTVAFDGVAAVFKVIGGTRIVATAPANLATGKISVTTPKGTGSSKTNFVVTPGLQLSATMGPPLTVLQISGAGFHPSTALDIYFDTADQALAITTAKGLISMQMQVPASAQPGTHWVSLVARGTNVAVQAAFKVNVNWPMAGLSPQGRNTNAYENTIGTANVSRLEDRWTKPSGGFANPSPFVEINGSVFVGDVNGAIHAYSSTGALLWMATPGSSLQSVTPVAYLGRVYFGAQNGNIYAYTFGCRADGGICTPAWTKSVGTSVTGSLRINGGKLYAPSSDGSIHVLNPANGAAGTPIFGIDMTHGAVTTPVTFAGDGTFYYGAGTAIEYRTANGSSGVSVKGGTVSPIAAANGAAYFTTGDGKINEFGGAGWSAATSGTNCAPAPAIANDLVYAGGCTTLAAFEAGRGTLRWSVTTAGPVFGLSVANGVLYGCVGTGAGFGGSLFAYDASFGSLLWSGGQCVGGAPIVANGTVFAAFASITAYRLPGFKADIVPARPAPRVLRPDYHLLPGRSRIVSGPAEVTPQ